MPPKCMVRNSCEDARFRTEREWQQRAGNDLVVVGTDSGSSLQPRCDAAASLRADIQIALHCEFFCAVARLTGAWIDQCGDLNRRLKAGGSGHAKTIFASNS